MDDEVKSEKIDKKKIETIKYLLSSLFARKQKYLIVDGNTKNRLIFANFPYERTINYRSEPEDSLCVVDIQDEVAPIFYEAFPIFEKVIAELELLPFMSAFNKSFAADKTKWPIIEKDDASDKLLVKIHDKEGTDQTIIVGRLLPPDSASYFSNIMDNFMSWGPDKDPIKEVEFDIPQGHFDDPLIYIDIPKFFESRALRFPIKDGLSVVSFKEYLNKRNLPPHYKALVQYRPDVNAFKIAFEHFDDWVRCLSLMPGTMWLPFVA